MHRARRGFRRGVACPELARHRARLGAVLASDILIGRMIASFGSEPTPSEQSDEENPWRAAVRTEAGRRDGLSLEEGLAEAAIRRRLTSSNLSEHRRGRGHDQPVGT